MVRVQVEDRLRPAGFIDLRQRLAVEVDVLADQGAGAVIFAQQRPARWSQNAEQKQQMEDIQGHLNIK